MMALGGGRGSSPSLLKMVVADDRGLVATGCPPLDGVRRPAHPSNLDLFHAA
jgi:hypothetical protein